jgi:N-acetylated-alpha-linked acidic dipeptidase
MAILKQAAVCALSAATVVQACARERDFFLGEQPIVRRQDAAPFPPVLDENESILANSFDQSSIATWSYYYTHGLHVAGTNRTMAQYTADRWNENGFTAGLAEYCTQATCSSLDGQLR